MVVSFGGRARAPVVIHYSLLCYCWWVLERYDLSHSVCVSHTCISVITCHEGGNNKLVSGQVTQRLRLC